MTLEQMKKELGMKSSPAAFDELYKKIKETYKEHSETILSDEYITKTLTDCYALLPYIETVLEAAKAIRKNEAMRLLVCILEQWVKSGGNPNDTDYTAPSGEGVDYDFLHLFAAIPTMPGSVAFLRDRGVPEDIVAATMQEYDMCVEVCVSNLGRVAFDRGRLNWICHVIRNSIVWIGRLRFELPTKRLGSIKVYKNKGGEIITFADGMHVHQNGQLVGSVGCENEEGSFVAEVSESEDRIIGHVITDGNVAKEKTSLLKKEWELCLSKEDNVVPVHIPRSGSFDPEIVERSYAKARKLLAECFSDMPYKAFHCRSWMMSRDLRKVLKPDSNILAFQNKYIHYPVVSKGVWTLGNVFPGEGGLENLDKFSEDTSLQRNIKAYYKSGNYIYDDCGFFF